MTDEKSHPIPSQVPIFIGAALDFQKELARPSVDQVLDLRQCVAPPLFSSGSGGTEAGLAQIPGPYSQHGGFNQFLQARDEAYSASSPHLLPA